jgi:chromosome segregation protein
VRERAAAMRGTVERLKRSVDELSARIQKLDEGRTEAATFAGKAAAAIVTSREKLVVAVAEAQQAHVELTAVRQALDEARQALSLREADLRGLRQELGDATERLAKHEMALQKLAIQHTHLVEGVRERFRGLELRRVVGDYHKRPPVDAGHKARIQELTELLDRMGPVNVDAVREHAEAEKRYAYYAEQKADLEKALDDLEKAIAQMNRESKKLFKTTFETVNARFKGLFPKMFRGGQAELRLTNPDDMLETGIEILAQPPGKKLGNIELMSGGEKALTAVSLIFAIFQFKPSPFCILDEVDAPLDEANVSRYNEAIRTMTDRSQFILITHIKRTMQSVDVLYGVTMQEPGVSRLVSVKVNEAVQLRAPRAATPGEGAAAVA